MIFAVLVISPTCRPTIGGRGFSAAATSVWNSLPDAVSPFFNISVAVQKVIEDGTVRAILL